MATPAGDLTLLDHPLAQRLLSSAEPAQLAYTWLDGTPRTIPIWFHWDGEAVIIHHLRAHQSSPHCEPILRCQ